MFLSFNMTFESPIIWARPCAPAPTTTAFSDSGLARLSAPMAPAAPVLKNVTGVPSSMPIGCCRSMSMTTMRPARAGTPKTEGLSLFQPSILSPYMPAPSIYADFISISVLPGSNSCVMIGKSPALPDEKSL